MLVLRICCVLECLFIGSRFWLPVFWCLVCRLFVSSLDCVFFLILDCCGVWLALLVWSLVWFVLGLPLVLWFVGLLQLLRLLGGLGVLGLRLCVDCLWADLFVVGFD